MNVKEQSLTVQTPIPQKHLSRFKQKKGICLIRQNDKVIYIAASKKDIYNAVRRLFYTSGILSHLDYNRLKFEIVQTSFRSPSVESVLKRYFEPKYNKRIKKVYFRNPTTYEKSQTKRILEAFLNQTRFEVVGEHKTDSKTLK